MRIIDTLFLLLAVTLVACSSSNTASDITDEGNDNASSNNQIKIEKGISTFSINADKGTTYTVTSSSWLSLTSSDTSTGTYTFTSQANHLCTDRTGTVTLRSGNGTRTINVVQNGSFTNSNAKEMAAKVYSGWNLGNTMEAIGGETAWGSPTITPAIIHYVKSQGFNAVRIPCSWFTHVTNTSTYTIDSKWMARVKEVIEMVLAEDMVAIINIHWDNGWLENNVTTDKMNSVKNIQTLLWTQIAEAMKGYDEYLLLASANEPNASSAEQVSVLKTYHQAFVDAVRATGGNNTNRCLIVQAPNTDVDKAEQYKDFIPTDKTTDKMLVEVHFYSPWNFCGMSKDETWGKMAYFWGTSYHYTTTIDGVDRNSTWGEEAYVDTEMTKMKSNYVDKGYPVVLGEYGTMKRTLNNTTAQTAHDKSRQYWYQYVTKSAKQHGLIPFVWDANNILNRKTLTIDDSYALSGIKEGATQKQIYE